MKSILTGIILLIIALGIGPFVYYEKPESAMFVLSTVMGAGNGIFGVMMILIGLDQAEEQS